MTSRSGASHRVAALLLVGATAAGLAACAPEAPREPPGIASSAPAPSPSPPPPRALEPSGPARALATGLDAPWSILRMPDGSTLVSERDSGRIVEIAASGALSELGVVEGVAAAGEGGLLGIALDPEDPSSLFAYFTSATDNRLVRIELLGEPGGRRLGETSVIVSGIPRAGNHNGGRLAFGPDGALYVTTGDAGNRANAQDPSSLGGKILRLNADGRAPADNPTPGSPVYSLGHRNVQGIAWTADGRMWASEFGQNSWDELNLIEPGGNYGWPEVEGIAGDSRFVDPVQQWTTAEASPSGLAAIEGTLFLASLRGERIWAVDTADPTVSRAHFAGEFGRVRDVTAGPDGTLWFITSNTDGRGSPGPDDDALYEVPLR